MEAVFRNESTQEFVSYDLTFKSTPSGVLDTIALRTPTRQSLSYTLTLENPLSTPVAFTMSCNYIDGFKGPCTEIQGPPNFKIPGRTEAFEYTFEYFPLKVRTATARLVLSSHELGALQYDLSLMATTATQLPTERFKATLGDTVVKRLKFLNFCPVRTEYTIAIDSQEFSTVASISTPSAIKTGSEFTFDVAFEPSKLGESKATLTLSSSTGGDYTWPLYGECFAPKPTGPYVVKSGQRAVIAFKNVLFGPEQYNYFIDAPGFSVKASDSFRSKESKDIIVRYEGKDDARNAQLIVTSATENISWIFYLRGTMDGK
jgi:hydrocephalus-inducing protein